MGMHRSILQRVIDDYRTPRDVAIAAAWVDHTGEIDVACAGPCTTDSVFEVGSIGKSMTAAVIMNLANEGALALSDSVVDHLNFAPREWSGITIRQLLDHRSGLADYDDAATTDEAAGLSVIGKPLRFEPGKKFEYQNTNYCLLGAIISQRGESFRTVLQRDLIDRFRLDGVMVSDPTVKLSQRVKGYTAVSREREPYDSPAQAWMADGPVMATATGMAEWVHRYWSGDIVFPIGLVRTGLYGYFAGWRYGPIEDVNAIYHAGGVSGFESFVVHALDHSIAVLTNCDQSEPHHIAEKVVQALKLTR